MTIRPYRGISLIRIVALISLTQVVAGCSGDSQPNSNGSTDTIPDAFTFAPMTNVAPLLIYASAPVTLTGLSSDAAASAAIDGEGCRLQINDGDASTEPRTVHNGDVIRLHATAASDFELETSCAVNIGGVIGTFAVTTGANAFAANVEPGKLHLQWGAFNGVTKFQIRGKLGGQGQGVVLVDNIPADTTSHAFDISSLDVDWTSDRVILWADNGSSAQMVPQHYFDLTQALSAQAIHYVKASNTGAGDRFGHVITLSGNTLAIGVPSEDGADNDNENDSGAVYVFRHVDGDWFQEAYLKSDDVTENDNFGSSVALDGDVLVIGAPGDDITQSGSGVAYVFRREATGVWLRESLLKAALPGVDDHFGSAIAISGDLIAVSAIDEGGTATNINQVAGDDCETATPVRCALNSGAAYVFHFDGTTWMQEAYIKASNTGAGDAFGASIALSGDTLAIGAPFEDSGARGIDGRQDEACPPGAFDNCFRDSGAAYIFRRVDSTWQQEAYVKSSNNDPGDEFGTSVAVLGDLLAVGATLEDSAATGVNGDEADNAAGNSGAAYVFRRTDAGWQQDAYIKGANSEGNDRFGRAVALAADSLFVGAPFEDSAATGIGGDAANNDYLSSGAAYLFRHSETQGWQQQRYIKAFGSRLGDTFGHSVGLTINNEGEMTGVVGANLEDGNTTGVNNGHADDCDETEPVCTFDSGAAYIY